MKPYCNPKKRGFFFIIPIIIFFAITGIVMWLWNSILPDVVGIKTITYWQAMGILVLSKILFGGFHGCKGNRPSGFQKRRFMKKMKSMTPEQREAFKQNWKARFQCNEEY